jgi:hypothetical protein
VVTDTSTVVGWLFAVITSLCSPRTEKISADTTVSGRRVSRGSQASGRLAAVVRRRFAERAGRRDDIARSNGWGVD